MGYHLKYKGPEIDRRLDLAGTALQEKDISHLLTKEDVEESLSEKQNVINDLDEIREGASLGATAIQSHQNISHLATRMELIEGLSTKVNKIEGKGLSTEDFTTSEKQKLSGLSNYDDTTVRNLIKAHEGEVRSALSTKVDKVTGKGLSTEDFTTLLKNKLEGLSNYDDSSLSKAVTSLQEQFNLLVGGNPSDAINSFNEIISFLDGIKDSQDLESIIASIQKSISDVQTSIPTKVSQLENDNGYLTEHQDISGLATKEELNGKQNIIGDLASIREGAAKGATALQSVPSEYAKITDVQDLITAAITDTLNTEV